MSMGEVCQCRKVGGVPSMKRKRVMGAVVAAVLDMMPSTMYWRHWAPSTMKVEYCT